MSDLNDIVQFIRVAETGSFTAAARSLSLPKTSVSRRVARLEAALGIRLFHRTTRQLRLTTHGESYLALSKLPLRWRVGAVRGLRQSPLKLR